MRLYVNHFPPSFQLRSKTRPGATGKQVYHKPATPCARLLGPAAVAAAVQEKRRSERDPLDPVERWHRLREGQAAFAALGSGAWGGGPGRESLEQFRAKLPALWRVGAARPTHRLGAARPQTWRTRTDPFEGVWSEMLWWRPEDPEATATSLFARLQQRYPGRFARGQLRTWRRRIGEWRRALARALVYSCWGGQETVVPPVGIGAGGDPREAVEGEAFPSRGG